jgi:hypothetical protein
LFAWLEFELISRARANPNHTFTVGATVGGEFHSQHRTVFSRHLGGGLPLGYLPGIARENKMRALVVGGVGDHVHVLLSIPSTLSVAKAIQLLKGNSSKWVHDTFKEHWDFEWQEGYGAFSIGISGVEDTTKHIQGQQARAPLNCGAPACHARRTIRISSGSPAPSRASRWRPA